MSAMAETSVAKRNDVTVKMDAEVVHVAKIVSAHRNISLAEYLSVTLKPIVDRELKEYSRLALSSEDKPERSPKGKKP